VDAPLPGLDLWELALPWSVVQHDLFSPRRQVPGHCRARICLLKGCEQWFSPLHPLSRYCSEACSRAARLWSRRRAAQRYRASDKGKERRRQQACRYRERVRQRRKEAETPATTGEGHQEEADSEKISCSRPGCYERFSPQCRSPLKKFCSCPCRKALRRVRRREARWGLDRERPYEFDWPERSHGPPDEFG
jgi:hypothetical protein